MTIEPEDTQFQQIVSNTIREIYGVDGSLSRLPGENINYLVQTQSGNRYVAKIAGDDLPEEVVEMEFQALSHAQMSGLRLQLPQIIRVRNGQIEARIKLRDNGSKRLRLISYLNYKSLEDITDISDELRANIGKSVAQFDQAMDGFDHPAAHRSHRWNLTEAGQHRHAVSLLKDEKKAALLSWAFDQWETQARPRLEQLPRQFIHGDLNPENILIKQDKVAGFLDFGDSGFNPTVCELAICLAYQMMQQQDPMATARKVIAGYESVRKLSAAEQEVVFPLVLGRLAVTISVATQRRQLDPNHPNWFVSEESAWELLGRLRE